MKRTLLLFALLIGLVGCSPATPAPAPTATPEPPPPVAAPLAAPQSGLRTFAILPAESSAAYRVNEEFFADALGKYGINAGQSVTEGRTQQVSGFLQLDLAAAQPLGENRFVVDLASLTSDQSLRDGWLRDNALESSKYPEAVFVASSIVGGPTDYTDGEEATFQLAGELTVRSIALPVTFNVTATLRGDTIQGVAEAAVKMSDFGINPPNFANTLVVADLFTIRVEFSAKEQ